jgi:hypothetical protein
MMQFACVKFGAIAAFAAALAAPATAQQWHAREAPLIPGSGQANPMCHIGSGEDLPFVMFTFEKDRTRFAVGADEFLDRDDIREYQGTLPSGASIKVSLGSDPASNLAVLTLRDREGGLRLIEHFLVAGDFSITGHGIDIAIPALPSASGEIENLKNCLKELDNG